MLGLKVNTLTIENTGLCLKVNTESKQRGRPRKIGIYDDNLQGYMLYFINAKLRDDLRWMAGDIRSECILSILTQDNLKHLSQYIIPNKMPYGKDLSLLKAIMFRQRLKHIEIETRREDVTVSYTEEYRREDDG